MSIVFCIVIPVFKNEKNISQLINDLATLSNELDAELKVTFVVDGSPDYSYEAIKRELPRANFSSKLLVLSRNFGSVIAVKAGLSCSNADYFAVMAADSQEPIELYIEFLHKLIEGYDIVIGERSSRVDSGSVKLFATIGWWIYKNLIFKELPRGGVDVFGCTKAVKEHLVGLSEKNSSLIGKLYWLGFKKAYVVYERKKRLVGKSAWNFFKSLRYFLDSCFNFTDLPIRSLWILGTFGVMLSIILGISVVAAKLLTNNSAPGYSMIVILLLFFGSINLVGIGIVGEYVVRAFENSKRRPEYIFQSEESFDFP